MTGDQSRSCHAWHRRQTTSLLAATMVSTFSWLFRENGILGVHWAFPWVHLLAIADLVYDELEDDGVNVP